MEPSIFASFNILKNRSEKAHNFINIIPTLKVNTEIIDSWKFGIVLKNVNIINNSSYDRLVFVNGHSIEKFKNKSSFEFGLDIEKRMLDNQLSIYGGLNYGTSASKFNFNVGFKFNF